MVRLSLLSSVKWLRQLVEVILDLLVCLGHPSVLQIISYYLLFQHNRVQDSVLMSLVQNSSLHTWTYDRHYMLPSQALILTCLQFRWPYHCTGLPYPSESVFFLLPESFHKLHRGYFHHARYLQNAGGLLFRFLLLWVSLLILWSGIRHSGKFCLLFQNMALSHRSGFLLECLTDQRLLL